MSQVKSVLKSRVIKGGHAIEIDLLLEDDSTQITEIPYERIPMMMHALSNAGALAERTQKGGPGDASTAVMVTYRAASIRTGSALDGSVVVICFATPQGPVEVAMTPDLTRWTIERLSNQLALLAKSSPKLS